MSTVTITFIAKGIKETKTLDYSKTTKERRIERFRIDMLAKHGLLFTEAPHIIKESC